MLLLSKHFTRFLKSLDYTTVDLYSPLADVKADICDLPFKENQFDVILCNHVLEHIPDDKKAMEELYRVLKPGGWAILQVPLDALRLKTFQDDTITDPKERMRVLDNTITFVCTEWTILKSYKRAGFLRKLSTMEKN